MVPLMYLSKKNEQANMTGIKHLQLKSCCEVMHKINMHVDIDTLALSLCQISLYSKYDISIYYMYIICTSTLCSFCRSKKKSHVVSFRYSNLDMNKHIQLS